MSTATPMIEIRGLHKQFGTVTALNGIDLRVERGEVVCLIGPSGSGKSTLLRSINHLETPTRGEVLIDGQTIGQVGTPGSKRRPMSGRELARMRSEVGMVFQLFYLWPHLRVLDNVTLGMTTVRRLPCAQARQQASALLAKVGLAGKQDAYPEQLSGGQRQRVAIARALAMTPKIILFDEPTSALDPERVGEVLETMETVAADGMTMMVATHEMGFARRVADRVVFMVDGHIVEQGDAAQIFDRPRSERLKQFLDKVMH
ncbi:MAG TPA: amino acid ABC transporter ATP-binding protein [Pararobbsia sp.]|nr:amino acid ABC transporter ATP-binding protein [Pararobbsia sp.]